MQASQSEHATPCYGRFEREGGYRGDSGAIDDCSKPVPLCNLAIVSIMSIIMEVMQLVTFMVSISEEITSYARTQHTLTKGRI